MSASESIVVVDIGGTHARFALARLKGRQRPELSEPVTLATGQYTSLTSAWQAFAKAHGSELPRAASISVAAPLMDDTVRLTNSAWIMRQSTLAVELGLDSVHMLNDFCAMAWAVSRLGAEELQPVCGPDQALPTQGPITVLGPGTGLGVGLLVRDGSGDRVFETEGGHVDFAPLDAFESRLAERLRERFLRVSTERVVSGPGLANIVETLAALESVPYQPRPDSELWRAALSGEDRLAAAALERFCLCLGAVAGDLALVQGATAVVLTGSIVQRVHEHLRQPGFAMRFCAKGRFQSYMQQLPVRLAVHPQPGLLGAAAAFTER